MGQVIFYKPFFIVFRAGVGTEWIGLTYIISNYFVILMGVWSEHDKVSPMPVQMVFKQIFFAFLNFF